MDANDSALALRRPRLTVDEFHRMGESGVLAPESRVELIEGEVIDMAPMGSRHAAAVRMLNQRLVRACGNRAIVSCQLPLRLSAASEPEPDLMLLVPRADFYAEHHPVAADVLLLIEVADTSLAYDRDVKLPLYARHGVAEVWLVDLENHRVQFFSRPVGEGYRDISVSEIPRAASAAALPGVPLDLTGLFG